MSLETEIKAIARENGAVLVGIASRDRLDGAPPSADPDYLMPSTRSVISVAIPIDRNIIRDFLSKKIWLEYGAEQKSIYQKLYTISDRLADFLREKGFDARGVDANSIYRPEPGDSNANDRVELVPDFSHRYAAVAAGLGQLGWSSNLMTPQFGSAVMLASVLTSAVLEADPLLETNPCDQCKLCTTVCPVERLDKKKTDSMTIADKEYTHNKKKPNATCIVNCGEYHNLGPNKKWSSWSPYRTDYPLPEDKDELIDLARRVRAADPSKQGARAFLTQRDKCFNPNETYINTCSYCMLICWEKREDREENQRLLMNSGVVVLSAERGRIAVPAEQAVEIDTQYEVKVAVPREEYVSEVPRGETNVLGNRGEAGKLDDEVLSFLAGKRAEPVEAGKK